MYVNTKASVVRHRDLLITATLPAPHASMRTYDYNNQLLQLFLTSPKGHNSGRFILRYDCEIRGVLIELEYRSVSTSGSSDAVVTRRRSCFVVGEISRVTVWFASGRHTSSVPAVVNATSGEGEMAPILQWICI